MCEITIDCAAVSGAEQLHAALKEALSFPEWYGANLDALYDCLTERGEPTVLCLKNFESLGMYAEGFRWVLEDACSANPRLTVRYLP